MSKLEIPESWALASIADIAAFIRGITFPAAAKKSSSTPKVIPCLRTSNIQATVEMDDLIYVPKEYVRTPKQILQNNDILMSLANSAELVGKVAQVKNVGSEMTFGGFLGCIRAISLNPDYTFFYLRSSVIQNKLRTSAKRTTNIANLSGESITGIEVPIPPEAEQKRIVAKIESTQEKIKIIEQSVTKAEQLIGKYRESILQKTFRGELVPQDPNDEPASKLLERIRAEREKANNGKKKKKDDLRPIKPEEIPFEIPKAWEWVRLGDICEFEQGLQVDTSAQKTVDGKGLVPFWRIINFTQNDPEIRFIDDPGAEYHITDKDVVMVRYGATAGFAAAGRAGVLANNLFTIRSNLADKNYLLQFFSSTFYQKALARFVRGGAMPAINFEFMKNLLLPLPPKAAQQQIVNEITSAINRGEVLSNSLESTKASIRNLNDSIFKSAFSGRLVGQDLSEGTGHELLEKIKAQAIGSDGEKKPSKKRAKV